MQALVGAFVDVAGSRVLGMALAEGDEVPGETILGPDQLEDQTEGSSRSASSIKRHVELPTAGEPRALWTLGLTRPPSQPAAAGLDLPTGALCLHSRGGVWRVAADLFLPLFEAEDHGSTEMFFPCRTHWRELGTDGG